MITLSHMNKSTGTESLTKKKGEFFLALRNSVPVHLLSSNTITVYLRLKGFCTRTSAQCIKTATSQNRHCFSIVDDPSIILKYFQFTLLPFTHLRTPFLATSPRSAS